MDKREDFKVGIANKSHVYITPMLCEMELALRSDKRFPQDCYRNTFLGDKTKDGTEGKILLLYQLPKQTTNAVELWNNFEVYLTTLPTYCGDYKADKYHRMFVYNIPDRWQKDYQLFLDWKPSLFSKEYKDHINLFYGDLAKVTPTNHVLGVLYKTEDRFTYLEKKHGINIPRTQEASSIPYWDEEYYQEEYKHKNVLETNNGELK